MSPPSTGLAQSVQTRLVRHAKHIGMDPNLVFTRFAVERFLYRLSRSPHGDPGWCWLRGSPARKSQQSIARRRYQATLAARFAESEQ